MSLDHANQIHFFVLIAEYLLPKKAKTFDSNFIALIWGYPWHTWVIKEFVFVIHLSFSVVSLGA